MLQNVSSCGANLTLRFFKYLPYGLDPSNNYYPDCQWGNDGYINAAVNNMAPRFWGWAPFFNLVDLILNTASSITNLLDIEEWPSSRR